MLPESMSDMAIFHQPCCPIYDNVLMIALPDFHDGYFDGVWTSADNCAFLFLRTRNGKRSAIVLDGLVRLNTSNFMASNIILDVAPVEADKLSITHIEQLYHLQPEQAELAHQLLTEAKQRGLLTLEISASYGAECIALFRALQVLPSHVLPSSTETNC
jgi:hypothetical protein